MKRHLPSWIKRKSYTHIGLPLPTGDDLSCAISYVCDKNKVARHAFSPLIRKVLVNRRYRRGDDGRRRRTDKKRQICYACHIDAAIYGYYSYLLSQRYENRLSNEGFGDSVLAYRKIPAEDTHGNKCNIHFAHDAFNRIKAIVRDEGDVTAMVFDIKGFFDNLDHRLLKESWKEISGYDSLPEDEYAVYRHVVRYNYIDQADLFSATKDNQISLNGDGSIRRKRIAAKRHMRAAGIVAYCEKRDLRQLTHLMRQGNQDPTTKKLLSFGIPQGLAISAVLANIYMLPFDKTIHDLMGRVGGFYRRYSDDIIVVCQSGEAEMVKWVVMDEIAKRKLAIEENKTKSYRFRPSGDSLTCEQDKNGHYFPSALEYLGFSFNGRKVLLKSASVNQFYYLMHKGVKTQERRAVRRKKTEHSRINVNLLLNRFTVRGAKGYRMKKNAMTGDLVADRAHPKRNYLSYVWRACGHDKKSAIYGQLRRCRLLLERQIARSQQRIENYRPPQRNLVAEGKSLLKTM